MRASRRWTVPRRTIRAAQFLVPGQRGRLVVGAEQLGAQLDAVAERHDRGHDELHRPAAGSRVTVGAVADEGVLVVVAGERLEPEVDVRRDLGPRLEHPDDPLGGVERLPAEHAAVDDLVIRPVAAMERLPVARVRQPADARERSLGFGRGADLLETLERLPCLSNVERLEVSDAPVLHDAQEHESRARIHPAFGEMTVQQRPDEPCALPKCERRDVDVDIRGEIERATHQVDVRVAALERSPADRPASTTRRSGAYSSVKAPTSWSL